MRPTGITKSIAATAFVAALAVGGLAAQDKATPSFDCAKETGAVEQAICGNQELAQLDETIAARYKVAREALSAADAAVLRADQRAWLATRPDLLAQGIDALEASMRERVTIMEETVLNAYPLLGEWVNHAASIMIRDRRGLII